MNNERGIFILTALKKILDKLIYVEKYDGIDKNMSAVILVRGEEGI